MVANTNPATRDGKKLASCDVDGIATSSSFFIATAAFLDSNAEAAPFKSSKLDFFPSGPLEVALRRLFFWWSEADFVVAFGLALLVVEDVLVLEFSFIGSASWDP